MNESILDTDILSEILKGVDQKVVQKSLAYLGQFGKFTISVITYFEIIKGYTKKGADNKLHKFLSMLQSGKHRILSLDIEAADVSGKICAELERAGTPIGLSDVFISSIAIVNNLALVTNNQRHFKRVQDIGFDLKLDNWK